MMDTISPDTLATDSRRVTRAAITVLTFGWRISFAIIIVGLVLAIVRDEPLAAELGRISKVMDDLAGGHSNGFLGLGILVMILSPIVATATIAVNFFRIGDRRYGLISSTVFIVLVVSIAIAIG
ncbi:MAG TPA: DUF1634 domain-containing protein [Thermomicrobiales bacterium]|nr:DUF1634 domain-containing protein [Thermomicrobiales bacterium]